MEEIIKSLIKLNIHMEGVLRVALDRPSEEAVSEVRDIYERMGTALSGLSAPVHSEEEATRVKEEEAEGAEETPLEEPSESDMHGQEVVYDDAEAAEVGATTGEKSTSGKAVTVADIRSHFTLNDVFLFRRELFNNSETEFNDTLHLIASMPHFDEVKEYLLSDLQWNPEQPEVKDFLAVVENVFTAGGK